LFDALLHLGRRVARGGLVEIRLCDIERAHPEIKRPKLEVDARQIRVEQQHPFERGDRRLVVAKLGRDIGIGEGRVQIGWIGQHFLEELVLFRLKRGAVVLRPGRAR
jgi:hypothetical protein